MRQLGPASFEEYLEWLKTIPVDMEALRRRKLPIGYEPFSLADPPPREDASEAGGDAAAGDEAKPVTT